VVSVMEERLFTAKNEFINLGLGKTPRPFSFAKFSINLVEYGHGT